MIWRIEKDLDVCEKRPRLWKNSKKHQNDGKLESEEIEAKAAQMSARKSLSLNWHWPNKANWSKNSMFYAIKLHLKKLSSRSSDNVKKVADARGKSY